MGGPEVAGELYKVFRTWLSERILQGSSTVALAAPPAAVAKGGAEDGGAEDTGAEAAAAAPTTVETIAAIVKEILAVSNTLLRMDVADTMMAQCVIATSDTHTSPIDSFSS